MRVICVFLSFVALSIAVFMAVVDATRSIAAQAWVFTPLGDTWRENLPSQLLKIETSLKASAIPVLWDLFVFVILDPPGWVVFGVLAFLFHALGWRRKKKKDSFGHIYR